ncbi:MAG: fibronectin type III domain-containing protein, partial [Dolichospermum sp.]
MKNIFLSLALAFGLFTQIAQAQTPKLKVGTNPTNFQKSAALEVQSTNKGFLPPRMNLNQISAISSPAVGLSVYCTDCSPKALLNYDGTNWVNANGAQPVAPPAVPTSPVATARVGSASVAFTAPTSTGSGAIVSYKVTSIPGGKTATGTASPIVVTGLNAGTAYNFVVTVTNASGLTASSVQSNSVTPSAGVPDAPTNLVATSTLGGTAIIAFTPPANTGGTAITEYVVNSTSGLYVIGSSSPLMVTGLTNGTSYRFTATARNSQGYSPPSELSNAITPQATAPGIPTIGTATISGTTASVAFTAPTNN